MASERGRVFDYRALRLLMGLIAFGLPFAVTAVSTTSLSSISASYYTEARDVFVGLLFVVGALLWAYNGKSTPQGRASKVAAIAAAVAALFPTLPDGGPRTATSVTHYLAAATLFGILAYFCLGPFRSDIKGKGGKKGRRSKVYFACGVVMIVCMLTAVVGKFVVGRDTLLSHGLTYWAETFALIAFGIAWIVSGKVAVLSPLVDDDEALRLF